MRDPSPAFNLESNGAVSYRCRRLSGPPLPLPSRSTPVYSLDMLSPAECSPVSAEIPQISVYPAFLLGVDSSEQPDNCPHEMFRQLKVRMHAMILCGLKTFCMEYKRHVARFICLSYKAFNPESPTYSRTTIAAKSRCSLGRDKPLPFKTDLGP